MFLSGGPHTPLIHLCNAPSLSQGLASQSAWLSERPVTPRCGALLNHVGYEARKEVTAKPSVVLVSLLVLIGPLGFPGPVGLMAA